MGVLKVTLVFSLICIAYVSSQSYRQSSSDLSTDVRINRLSDVASSISSMVVDWAARAASYISEIYDLKVRLIRFLASLYTTDNLVLVKRVMNIGLRFTGWLYSIIPDSTTEGNTRFLSTIFPRLAAEDSHAAREEDELEDVPWDLESSSKSSLRSNELERVNEKVQGLKQYEQQVVNLQTLINARGNFKH